jgi:RecB family exonuclease
MSEIAHPTPRRLSASALRRFETCPKQFYLADVARADKASTESPRFAQANAVHHALERFYGLPLEHRSGETLIRALRFVWPMHRGKDLFLDKKEEAAYGLQAIAMLESYANNFDLAVRPLAREQWLSTRLAGRIELFGKLDRIDRRPDGTIQVIDYKTSERSIDECDLPGDIAAQTYAVLARAAYQSEVSAVRYIYLPLGSEVSWRPEQEDVDQAEQALEGRVDQILNAESFPAQPGRHCRYCPFALTCAERQQVSLDDLTVTEELAF